jgi:choline dehydrogenase
MARRTSAQEPKLYWRGRGLGGSSAVNAQIAIRGVPDAFDAWAEAGCEGWGFDALLPHFRRLENDPVRAPWHGDAGPVPIHRAPPADWGPVDRGLHDAALALGYPAHADLNAPDGEGVANYPINSRDGRRVSTNEAFLEPARGRANLTIQPDALVDRVILQDGAAKGVRVRLPGFGWRDLSARMVVLSAGAVHSPAVLWRSGLGPAAELRALGIAVVRDMPAVGRHFIEHPTIRAALALHPGHRPTDPDARHTNLCVSYSSGLGGGGRRDMLLIAMNHRGFTEDGAGPGSVVAGVYEAFSRGEIRLASADPETDPLVEASMLSDPRDRLRLRDAVRRMAALVAHPALAGIAAPALFGMTELAFAEAARLPDDALDSLMLQECGDAQHAAGTCRMTAWEDPRGVTNPDGTVKGVAGLRVADASIMPSDCRANTHFTCMMIGAVVAERIVAS